MTNSNNDSVVQSDAAVEELLAQATPRPLPPDAVRLQAREAVATEWRRVTRRRRTWRIAAAASVLTVAIALLANIDFADVEIVQVATLDSAMGTMSVLDDQGIVVSREAPQTVVNGQTFETDANAAVGLAWGRGGSLRLDANTSVTFIDADQIELRRGRIYFDSNTSAAGNPSLLIHTDFGDVRHLGTQFMAQVNRSDLLTVSVRQGQVSVEGLYYDANVDIGQRMVLHGNRAPIISRLATYGGEWRWVEAVAPAPKLEGKDLYQILEWVQQETGMSFRFETSSAESAARVMLNGVEGQDPMAVLSIAAATAGLSYQQIDGVIVISQTGN